MFNKRFQRILHHFLLALLTIGLVMVMFSPSAKSLVGHLGWKSMQPRENGIDIKSVEFAQHVCSQHTNEPFFLRYLTRLLGNDWLGADWVYIGFDNYRYPVLDKSGRQLSGTNPVTGVRVPQWNYARFWIDPGPALLKTGDTLWVWGYPVDSYSIYADNILVNPPARVTPPSDVGAYGRVLAVSALIITDQDPDGIRFTVTVDPYTTYSFPSGEGLACPHEGLWLNISWLTEPARMLGRYDGFHGTYRGILRLDFSQP